MSTSASSPDLDSLGTTGTLNVLVLDGGGVKGLSSLIILRKLLHGVERYVSQKTGRDVKEGSLRPDEVFGLVVGTSTGGLVIRSKENPGSSRRDTSLSADKRLIALMVGKLGMSVGDCIERYRVLSGRIFGHGRHWRGTTFRGLIRPKYCGRRMRTEVESLIQERGLRPGLQMVDAGYTNCAVVCRMYDNRYEGRHLNLPLVFTPTVICSHRCREYFECSVCQAALATSAAPTYFSQQQIGENTLIDGGLGYNNPSWAAFDHYNNANKKNHPNAGWESARVINIGTGTSSPDHPGAPRKGFLSYISTPRVISLLKEAATSSEAEAAKMRALAYNANFEFQRFSADTGVCWIKLDAYERLDEIETLTDMYLRKQDVQQALERCAINIATGYIQKNGWACIE